MPRQKGLTKVGVATEPGVTTRMRKESEWRATLAGTRFQRAGQPKTRSAVTPKPTLAAVTKKVSQSGTAQLPKTHSLSQLSHPSSFGTLSAITAYSHSVQIYPLSQTFNLHPHFHHRRRVAQHSTLLTDSAYLRLFRRKPTSA